MRYFPGTVKLIAALPFFICLGIFRLEASLDLSPNCINAFNANREFRFGETESLARKEFLRDPSNRLPVYQVAEGRFIKALLSEEEADYKAFETAYPSVYKMISGEAESSLRELLTGKLDFYVAVIYFKQKKYLQAAMKLKKAYSLFNNSWEEYKHPAFKTELGVLHALFSTIPDNYAWIFSMAGINGNFYQGRNELLESLNFAIGSQEYHWLRTDALLYLTYLELNLKGGESPEKYISGLVNRHFADLNSSPVLCFIKTECYMKSDQNDKALQVLRAYTRPQDAYAWLYFDYLKGLCLLRRLDPSAGMYYQRFVSGYQGNSFIKSAYQKLQWSYILQEKPREAAAARQKILIYGDQESDQDKAAFYDAVQNKAENVFLLKARLLFDGGYFRHSADILLSDSAKESLRNIEDSTEYFYRLGRIYDKTARPDQALEYYGKAIWYGSSFPSYYAANACLMSGEIYERQGDYPKAKVFYKRVLSFNPKQYKKSLQQKAKAGLNRLPD